jgi:hypothetical protein
MMVAAFACGGSEGKGIDATGDGGMVGPDADPSTFATLMGTVWVPGNGPGMVPAGEEIPVFDAVVYLSSQRPDPFVDGASCTPCTEAPPKAVQTDHDGNFMIVNVNPDTYWLIIEKGDFRLEQEITIAPNSVVSLTAEQTTLPSVDDPANGRTIPKIALATGIFDDMEDILGKMGMGSVDASGAFEGPSAAGVFEFYDNGGPNADQAVGTLADLVSSLDRMLKYDIIFIPCSGSNHIASLDNQEVLKNIRDYVAAGGKLYVTDWSGEWADNVFPEQVELAGTADTPAAAYNAATDTWDTTLFGDANGSPSYTSEHAEAIDEDLRLWLEGQMGPFANGGTGVFQASDMAIEGNWNHIEGLHSVNVGVDEEGQPIIDSPVKYVIGDDVASGPKKPLTVTFEPAGCGRVLYSTYHTTHSTHPGLAPQERVLVYLIMEIGVCKDSIIID